MSGLEDLVMERFNSNPDGTDKLEFGFSHWGLEKSWTESRENILKHRIRLIQETNGLNDRIVEILNGFQFETYKPGIKNIAQCHSHARRSAGDIFRIYSNYFDDGTTLFDIMRTLYQLAMDERICCSYCGVIEKRVFSVPEMEDDDDGDFEIFLECEDYEDEFGLELSDWRNLGNVKS